MQRLKITVAYDGTDFNGWQAQPAQPHTRTVEEVLAAAVFQLTGERPVLTAAGRTDAGVHARGQVASFTTASRIPIDRWPYALNGVLPEDVVVRAAELVPLDFHARYHARAKVYVYIIQQGGFPDVFWRRFAWHVPFPLDLEAMQLAAGLFQGEHDFYGFCASGGSSRNFVRHVHACSLSDEGNIIRISVTANGFLYNMVRIITGTLVAVGRGKIRPSSIPAIIASRRRELAGPTAPPHGLCLAKVDY